MSNMLETQENDCIILPMFLIHSNSVDSNYSNVLKKQWPGTGMINYTYPVITFV